MNDHAKDQPTPTRERFEQAAERQRSRVVADLDELNARRRSLEATLRHPALLIGAGVAAVVACGFLLYARRARHQRERQRDAILGIAARLLGPAYVVEPAAARHAALTSSLKKVGSAVVAAAGRELGRRAVVAVQTRLADLERPESRAPA